MDINQQKISLLPWYSNGEKKNDIGNFLSQLTSIVNENAEDNQSKEVIEDTAIEWTKRKQGTLFLIVSDQKQAVGTIALSPEQDTKGYARFGYLLCKQYMGKGVEALALEKLLPTVKKGGFTKISGSMTDGDVSFISQWEKLGLLIMFDDDGECSEN